MSTYSNVQIELAANFVPLPDFTPVMPDENNADTAVIATPRGSDGAAW